MPATILSDNGASSGTSGIKTTGASDGQLALQTTTSGGVATTAITLDTVQNATFAKNIGLGGTAPTTSGTGITFPATQSASTDVNTLDDYEEGTWTPTFLGVSSNPTVTYGRQEGKYVKVGQLVYATFNLYVTAISGGSGQLQVGGLPFTNQNVNQSDRACLIIGYVGGFSGTTTPTVGIVTSGAVTIDLYTNGSADVRDNKTVVVSCPPASTPNMYGTIVYRCNA